MKLKKILLSILLALLVMAGYSQSSIVKQTDAELAAQNFMSNVTNPTTNARFGLKKILKTVKNYFNDHPVSYTVIFDGGGFAVLAGSLNVDPIISYSPVGDWIETNVPLQHLWWMDNYHNMVDYVITNAIVDLTAQDAWKNLTGGGTTAQLMTSTWGQSGCIATTNGLNSLTYNKFVNGGASTTNTACSTCVVGGVTVGNCDAGCVAVAMGQIMRFWGYPINSYQWCNMPDNLNNGPTSIAQIDAVAKLLADLGSKVGMNDCASGCESSAWHDMVSTFKFYGYSNCFQIFLDQTAPGFELWKTTLRKEIQAGRPVFYSGSDKNANGHAWVIDGIDPDNDKMFHFNWGWNGHQNGYYHLLDYSLLSGTAYNRINSAIINISPDILNCNSMATIAANNTLPTSLYTGSITSTQIINNGATQNYYACGVIDLKPGFRAVAGSKFLASLDFCSRAVPYSRGSARKATTAATPNSQVIVLNESESKQSKFTSEVTDEGIISYPNPFKDILKMEVNITRDEPVIISFYTQEGVNLLNKKESLPVGRHSLTYDLSSFESGVYICVFKNSEVMKETRIVKE